MRPLAVVDLHQLTICIEGSRVFRVPTAACNVLMVYPFLPFALFAIWICFTVLANVVFLSASHALSSALEDAFTM